MGELKLYDVEQRHTLTGEQALAVEAILDWMKTSSNYFLLSGDAGTGKTYCIQYLKDQISGNIIYTAPTNKATKVLRTTICSEEYQPECRTIYSLLGLKLQPNGEVKELVAPENPVDLKKIKLVVVDEGSMVNKVLIREIEKAVKRYNLKILFMGDPNQLPPVGEKESEIWKMIEDKAALTTIMRFDNQILSLSADIKAQVNSFVPRINFKSDNAGQEGVWLMEPRLFLEDIRRSAKIGDFSRMENQVKVIAWRNRTVDSCNRIIRREIFDNADESSWFPGDRVILAAPAEGLEGEPIGHTDDEGTVEEVLIRPHHTHSNFNCYRLQVMTDENKRLTLWVLHEDSLKDFFVEKNVLAKEAKRNPKKWKDFWDFVDSFHQVKYAYAITAHRAQGSTYHTAFVVWNDILINHNRNEAFRCLYVACTRPKKRLKLGGI